MALTRGEAVARVMELEAELSRAQHERDAGKLEVNRAVDEAAFLRELLSELTGLSLTGVALLLALHRLADGLPMEDRRHELHTFDAQRVLEAMGDRWWPTGLIARALLPGGGRGIPANTRSRHHKFVAGLLRELESRGLLERRRVAQDGRVLDRSESAQGRTEWRRL